MATQKITLRGYIRAGIPASPALLEAEVLEHCCAQRIAVEGRSRGIALSHFLELLLVLLFVIFLEGRELSKSRLATSKVRGVRSFNVCFGRFDKIKSFFDVGIVHRPAHAANL